MFTLFAMFALFAMTSCLRSDPPSFAFQCDPALAKVHRILAVPSWHPDNTSTPAEGFDQAFSAAWRATGRWEVSTLSRADRDRIFGPKALAASNIHPEALRLSGAEYGVDAVLVVALDRVQSYDPVAFGVRAHLVSTEDGAILWSGGSDFDSQYANVQEDLREWFQSQQGTAQARIGGWKITLASPRLFARYIGDRLAASACPNQGMSVREP